MRSDKPTALATHVDVPHCARCVNAGGSDEAGVGSAPVEGRQRGTVLVALVLQMNTPSEQHVLQPMQQGNAAYVVQQRLHSHVIPGFRHTPNAKVVTRRGEKVFSRRVFAGFPHYVGGRVRMVKLATLLELALFIQSNNAHDVTVLLNEASKCKPAQASREQSRLCRVRCASNCGTGTQCTHRNAYFGSSLMLHAMP